MAIENKTIAQLIAQRVPAGFVFNTDYQKSLVQKWQLALKINLNPVPTDDEACTDELTGIWPYQYRLLIAACVVFDMINEIAAQAALGNLVVAANGSGGEVKKVITGPDTVEFIATSQSFVSFFKPTSTGQTSLDFLKDEMCSLALTLRIRIIACGPYKTALVQLKGACILYNDCETILNSFRPIAVTSKLYNVIENQRLLGGADVG